MIVYRPKASNARHKDGDWPRLVEEVEKLRTTEEVDAWWTRFLLYRHPHYPEPWSLSLKELCAAHRLDLAAAEMAQSGMDRAYAEALERDE